VRHYVIPVIALSVLIVGCSTGRNVPGASSPSSGSASSAAAVAAQPAPTSPPASGASTTASGATPVLGQSRGVTEGYGSVRPATISNGGDPAGIVMNVTWQSWGGAQAVGTGTGYYDPPNTPVAESKAEQATVVAFDLGTCDGLYMYQAIEWYFPASGGSFDASSYLNICSWTYHPSGGP
jgi:hypothetical protein